LDLPSRLTLYALGRGYLAQRAGKIDQGQVDILGSDANIFVGSQSVVAYSTVLQLGYSVSRLFLDGASGDDLDRLAFDRYGLTRKGASPALGAVQFVRPTFAAGAGSIVVGTVLQTLSGVQYVTITPAAFGASDTGSTGDVTANVRAVQAGSINQVGSNSITRFASVGSLFDQTILVTNPLPTAGGEDVENDDTFRARIRNFWNTARRGVLSAIEQGALTVPGVVSAQAVEVINGVGQPARIVQLYIADSTGVASAALAAQVQTALLDYRAAGIYVAITGSIPLIVNVSLALTYNAGVDTITLGGLIQAAVIGFVNSLPVNGPLYLSQLYSVLQRFVADGLVPSHASVIAPTGDLIPAPGQTLRVTPASVTY
jgi:uncharacterized phage protein gp47/JayE